MHIRLLSVFVEGVKEKKSRAGVSESNGGIPKPATPDQVAQLVVLLWAHARISMYSLFGWVAWVIGCHVSGLL